MEKLTDKESFELEYAIRKYIEDLEVMRETLDIDLAELRSMQKKIHYAIENKKI